jgi:hypothetical protein
MGLNANVFHPHEHEITANDIAREYAVAIPSATGRWQLTGARFSTRTDADAAVPPDMGAIVVTREVLPWQQVVDHEPWTPYAGEMDILVEQIVGDENRLLWEALERGADVLVTGAGKPGRRVAHRLGCTAASKLLDRSAAWEPHHRSRLAEQRDFRLALPHLTTVAAARDITRITSCGLCRPQIFGEPLQTRSLRAEALKTLCSLTSSVPIGALFAKLSCTRTPKTPRSGMSTASPLLRARRLSSSPARTLCSSGNPPTSTSRPSAKLTLGPSSPADPSAGAGTQLQLLALVLAVPRLALRARAERVREGAARAETTPFSARPVHDADAVSKRVGGGPFVAPLASRAAEVLALLTPSTLK